MAESVLPDGGQTPDQFGVGETEGRRRSLPSKKFLIIAGSGLVAIIVAVVVALAVLGGSGKDLTVTFALVDIGGNSSCVGGSGGYSDIGPGTDVVVRDNGGHVIGTSNLGDGRSESSPTNSGGCVWQTTVHNVPAGKDFYSVEVGSRGAQEYSRAQLEDRHWDVSLTLGGN